MIYSDLFLRHLYCDQYTSGVTSIHLFNHSYLKMLYHMDASKLWYGVQYLTLIDQIMGLLIYLKRNMTCLNLLWYTRPDRHVSIAARMSRGSKSNNDACVGLTHFVLRCVISLQQCTVGWTEYISSGCLQFPHLVVLI